MAKKKKYSSDFRKMGGIIYGGAMVGQMTPLLGNATIGSGNLYNAGVGMGNIAISSSVAGVAFDAIDNIYKAGRKKRK